VGEVTDKCYSHAHVLQEMCNSPFPAVREGSHL
jgi:hypothetical protein